MASGSQLNKTTATLPVDCAVLFGDFRADELVMMLNRVVPAFTTEWLPLPPDRLGYDILDVKMDQSSRSTNDVANDSSASQHGGSTSAIMSNWAKSIYLVVVSKRADFLTPCLFKLFAILARLARVPSACSARIACNFDRDLARERSEDVGSTAAA